MRHFISVALALICIINSGSAKQDVLALPAVPADLTQPADRATYILTHFWDDLDFTDSSRSHNESLMEQAFADFLSIFPHAPENAREQAVDILLQKAQVDPVCYNTIRKLSELYLYETDSPYLNEPFYTIFLEKFDGSPLLEEGDDLRIQAQLNDIRKNGPGSKAPDFGFTLRNGQPSTLYTYPSSGEIMLIFYNPDCGHCDHVIEALRNYDKLNDDIRQGHVTVMAIYSGDDRNLWEQTATKLPENWTVGYETGTLEEEDIYSFRSYPSIYILTPDRTVLQKNLSLQ